MEVRVGSLDERAAALLDAAGGWDLVARYERSFFLAHRPDGTLVSVVRNDLPDGPWTVRLDATAPRDLRVIGSVPRVTRDGARTWRPRFVAPAEAVEPGELERRLAILWRIVDAVSGPPAGARSIVPLEHRAAFEDALAADDAAGAARAAEPIAGLGPGLTPSGDDLIVGAIAMHAWAEAAGLGGSAAVRAAIVSAATSRTSRLSGQLLAAAAEGHVTEPLAGLLAGLLRRGSPFPPDVASVLAIGATSGSDLLVGVRLCGRALVRRGAPAGPL